jgi:hypothetical protein
MCLRAMWFYLDFQVISLLATCSFCPATMLHKLAAYLFFCYRHIIMSAPSTTSYYPFNSEAPAVFRNFQINETLEGE